MTLVSNAAALTRRAPQSAAQARKIKYALDRFPYGFTSVVKTIANQDPRLADLAVSFPAVLLVIAVAHKGIDGRALRAAVLMGAPLKTLARLAGFPLWLRKLPSHGLCVATGQLRVDALALAPIAHHVPTRKKDTSRWLHDVSLAAQWGTPGFAIWVARQPAHQRLRLNPRSLRWLSLWAWFSQHRETVGGDLCKAQWHCKLDVKGAVKRANAWVERVNLHLCLQTVPHTPRLLATQRDGFDFVHLATADMIADEASRMGNCIMGYGQDISQAGTELWSIRKDQASVATLSIERSRDDTFAMIGEIKGPNNKPVVRDAALAARRWFQSHDIEAISPPADSKKQDGRLGPWQSLFKPYWLDKQRLSGPWLPLSPKCCELTEIYLNTTRRRGW